MTSGGQDGAVGAETTADPVIDDAAGGEPTLKVAYSMSPGFVPFLAAEHISIAFSSYQSGKFYLLGRNPAGGLMVNEHFFQRAMGISVQGNAIYLATQHQIVRMENVLSPGLEVNNAFDACYVPRTAHTTGDLDAHDLGVTGDGEIIFVNTRYNCLSTLSPVHSFAPVWKPNFISRIVKEDRCHLNGLAMRDGKPAYVSAVSKSDTIDGWRDRRADGGVLIDVQADEIICEGLSMPHSPRVYQDRLWVLNSGAGELGWVAPASDGNKGVFHPLAFCPGFLRGLAFYGKYALVGLSKPRYARFEGLSLDERLQAADSDPWCGVQVIDIETGVCVEWFRIDGAISELYDIDVIPGVACGMSLGLATDEIFDFITHDDLP